MMGGKTDTWRGKPSTFPYMSWEWFNLSASLWGFLVQNTHPLWISNCFLQCINHMTSNISHSYKHRRFSMAFRNSQILSTAIEQQGNKSVLYNFKTIEENFWCSFPQKYIHNETHTFTIQKKMFWKAHVSKCSHILIPYQTSTQNAAYEL